MRHQPTIGLEIHTQLKTQTKMFCASKNAPDASEPNVNVCPVCMGHPGTLPVVNKEAVIKVLTLGIALQGNLAKHAQFDRKSYFYPDLPKGYQISQYKNPLVSRGTLTGVKISRIHLEEDTGKIIHEGDKSFIDYNRAGVPLMELVTEPVINSAHSARKFAEELQLLLRYLDISDADMEKGHMRIEANVSLSMGTKVEIKNLNSFKMVEAAIEYEVTRQSRLLEANGSVVQETRGWNEHKKETVSQRVKEESHDYRYIPDPDLLPFDLGELSEIKIPELPANRAERLVREYGLPVDLVALMVSNRQSADYFESVARDLVDKRLVRLALNYLTSDIRSLGDEITIQSNDFSTLIRKVGNGQITSRIAKDTLHKMHKHSISLGEAIKESDYTDSVQDPSELAKHVIKNNPRAVSDYRSGKVSAIKYLVGQGVALSKGSINPLSLEEIIKETLNT